MKLTDNDVRYTVNQLQAFVKAQKRAYSEDLQPDIEQSVGTGVIFPRFATTGQKREILDIIHNALGNQGLAVAPEEGAHYAHIVVERDTVTLSSNNPEALYMALRNIMREISDIAPLRSPRRIDKAHTHAPAPHAHGRRAM